MYAPNMVTSSHVKWYENKLLEEFINISIFWSFKEIYNKRAIYLIKIKLVKPHIYDTIHYTFIAYQRRAVIQCTFKSYFYQIELRSFDDFNQNKFYFFSTLFNFVPTRFLMHSLVIFFSPLPLNSTSCINAAEGWSRSLVVPLLTSTFCVEKQLLQLHIPYVNINLTLKRRSYTSLI